MKALFISCAPLLLGVLFSYCSVISVLHVFWIQILTHMWDLQIFSSVCGLSFHFLSNVFWRTKPFNFNEAQSMHFFYFVCHAFGAISKNSLPNSGSHRFSFVFSYSFFNLGFTFKSMIHFKLSFVWDVKYVSRVIYLFVFMTMSN